MKWEKLPKEMQTKEVREYYDILKKKKVALFCKRMFDIVVSTVLLVLCFPVFVVLSIMIKVESPGPVFYRQLRVTQYGKTFRIFKFRTMIANADKIGSHVTTKNDVRITKVGRIIRKCRLDEVCQLIDVFRGTMTFVGTRPEAVKYVSSYSAEMMATLLLPAGVTSLASIYYKDEAELLDGAENVDETYVREVLPRKMYFNLQELREYSFFNDIIVMIKTVLMVFGKEYTCPEKVD